MNRMINDAARRAATMSTDQMIPAIRDMVGSPKTTSASPVARLSSTSSCMGKTLLFRSIGRTHAVESGLGAATRVWTSGWPCHARKKFAGFRIAATDTPWAVGEGEKSRARWRPSCSC